MHSAGAATCTGVHSLGRGWVTIDPPPLPAAGRVQDEVVVGGTARTVLVTDGGAIYRSTDRGCRWSSAYAPATQDYPASSGAPFEISALAVGPARVTAHQL